MKLLDRPDIFCRTAVALVTALLLGGGLACSPNHSSSGQQAPPPAILPPGYLQNAPMSEGPGVGGGGDIARPEAPEIVMDLIARTRQALKERDLYYLILRGSGLNPTPSSIVEEKIHEKLVAVIYPNNPFQNRPWESEQNKMVNSLAETIEQIPIEFAFKGPCKSADKPHADASVNPMNEHGTICFSIFNLMKYPLFSLDAVIAGLWFHELAHMRGMDEVDASLLQGIVERSYTHIATRYYNTESQDYRSVQKEILKNLNQLSQMTPTEGAGVINRLVGRIESQFDYLHSKLYASLTTKTCEFIDDQYKEVLAIRYTDMREDLEKSRFDFLERKSIGHEDFLFRIENIKTKLFLVSEHQSCRADVKLICSNREHRKSYLNHIATTVNDAFFEALSYYWERQNALFEYREKTKTPNASTTSADTIQALENIIVNLVEMHTAINKTQQNLRALFSVIKDFDCVAWPWEKILLDRQLEDVTVVADKIAALGLSPLKKYLNSKQAQLFKAYENDTIPYGVDTWQLREIIQQNTKTLLTDELVEHLEKGALDERKHLEEAFEAIRWLYFHASLSERGGTPIHFPGNNPFSEL